jgi:hypothetical protein
MLVAASVCPHPPLLVPEVSVVAPAWLVSLREECEASVRGLADSGADEIVVVGTGDPSESLPTMAGGTLRPYGVDIGAGGDDQVLPLSLTIGAWLLDRAEWRGPRCYVSVAAEQSPTEVAALGTHLPQRNARVAILVMGDGSAKRSIDAPGYLDPRAESFDAAVVTALEQLDVDRLLAIDRALSAELWVAGAPAWQCFAGAAAVAGAARTATVRYDDAPRGVGYFVVDWTFG